MKILRLTLLILLLPLMSLAVPANLPGGLTYEGVITDTVTGNPLDLYNSGTGTPVYFYIISGSSGTCVLYRESATMMSSTGVISQNVGSGTVLNGVSANIPSYFNSTLAGGISGVLVSDLVTACLVYPADARFLRVSVPSKSIVADVTLSSVPYALYAGESKSVGGYDPSQLIRLANGVATAGSEFNAASWTELQSLIAGTSNQYIKSATPIFATAPQWSGAPSAANDLTNKNYVDTQLAAILPNVGIPGTYTKVTTDSKGRVTAGSSLIATDIPNLDASKITSGVLSPTFGGSKWLSASSDIYFNTGKVGIGTLAPATPLDITDPGTNGPGIRLTDNGTPRIQFNNTGSGGGVWQVMNGYGPLINNDFSISAGVTGANAQGISMLYMLPNGTNGIGTITPSASLHIRAGTTAASSAPIKLTLGSLMTTPEAGALEYDGTNLYATNNSAARRAIASKSDIISITAGFTYNAAATDEGQIIARTTASGAGGTWVDLLNLPVNGEISIVHSDTSNTSTYVQIFDSSAGTTLNGQLFDSSAKAGGGNNIYMLAHTGSVKLRKIASGRWIMLSRSGQAGIFGCPGGTVQIGSGQAHTFCISSAASSGAFYQISSSCTANGLKYCTAEQTIEACQIPASIGITWPSITAFSSLGSGGMSTFSSIGCNTVSPPAVTTGGTATSGSGFCCSN